MTAVGWVRGLDAVRGAVCGWVWTRGSFLPSVPRGRAGRCRCAVVPLGALCGRVGAVGVGGCGGGSSFLECIGEAGVASVCVAVCPMSCREEGRCRVVPAVSLVWAGCGATW